MATSRSTSTSPRKKTHVLRPGTKTTSIHQQRFKANEYERELRDMREALRSFRDGDFSVELPNLDEGPLNEIYALLNQIFKRTEGLTQEYVRVSTVVAEEGKLSERASLDGATGGWAKKVDALNSIISELAQPTKEVARVMRAVAAGDLSQKVTVRAKGEILEVKETINTMVEQLRAFASEVTRVAKEVGTEGRLGGQADVKGVSGTWKDLTDNVNAMASNLTVQLRDVSKVATAIANGDLTQKITVDVRGEILQIKNVINKMVDTLGTFSSEVVRVAKQVGTEGKLGVQADVKGVLGAWKELTDSVNVMASNLTVQLRDVSKVATAIANGDLEQKITVDVKGEILQMKNVMNKMVDILRSFASEVTRVAREVGTEGKLGGQADVKGVAGTWKDLTNNVNAMASNLTVQLRDVSKVATAIAGGDLEQKIVVDVKGEMLQIKEVFNKMVDTLRSFSSEVTRVAREVGTEGKLGVQADVKGVAGTWKDLTDNVNTLTANLTAQVRNIAAVTTAVAKGDLSQKITVDVKGEILELKNTINTMVEQLNSFAAEVTRVAKEVGTEGKLGGQADVKGVSGTWRDLTENVNMLAGNLTNQVRNIAQVATAVAGGDLSQKITVEAKGEILELKSTLNKMVDQLNSFSAEVTRVAKEVGTEGRLGGQAQVRGLEGTWKDLTDNVNQLAGNLTNQVRNIAAVTTAVANGDLSQKITVVAQGEILELKDTINTMVDQLNAFAAEVTRVAREVGFEGKLGGQAQVPGVAGTWRELTDNVNQLAGNLTDQVRNIALVTTAVANGDLSKQITVEAKGEILELKNTINTMVDQLSSFAAEVTRVAREVGTEGKLAGQAQVPGVAGIWKDLTDNVNTMASNLTSQVRGIAKVVTAVANGDLSQKLLFEAKGEIAALADTINGMTDTLRVFADQVTSVAREVGVEGKLGGQAKVPGASGTWRGLTDNVNQLAGNLTTQVRSIADVATAVTKGDLTRSITVEAQGEVLQLKDNINQMIENLRNTTITNKEQDWLKTNLAKFTGMMQGQRSIESLSTMIMDELTPVISAQYGAFYVLEGDILTLVSSYAYTKRKHVSNRFAIGEGLVGQAAREKKAILVTDVPENYVHVVSGLGEAPPRNIGVFPVIFEGQLKAIVELGSFQPFSNIHLSFLDQLMQSVGVVFNMIGASTRTEELLKELQRSNAELEGRSKELEDKAVQLEVKNTEIAKASASLEEKARELQQISKYKSDFLANMSHELRTPLNSLLILAKMLSDNEENTLTDKQVEFARTIYNSGNDLLSLINEILDLSKIEAGKVSVEPQIIKLTDIREFMEQNFEQLAKQKSIDFSVKIDPSSPPVIFTDRQRLNQILKNLLSNAFKFTEHGSITAEIAPANPAITFTTPTLTRAKKVIAFHISDTGIGIPDEKQQLIWEAFQQADTTTARKYGGTGLGLTISRELVRLLGGEIDLTSTLGEGSTFTLYIPLSFEDFETRFKEGLSQIKTANQQLISSQDLIQHLAEKRALLIDDDPRTQYAISQLMLERHMRVKTASSAKEGIAFLKDHPHEVDVIVMDIVMPGEDGFEATSEIRSMDQFKTIPIIAYSGKTIPGAREKYLSSGGTEYIATTGEGEKLLSVISASFAVPITKSKIGSTMKTKEPRPTHAEVIQKSRRIAKRLKAAGKMGKALADRQILIIDDDARNLFAMTSFLESQGAKIFATDNAKEGIDLLVKHPGIDIVLMDIMLPGMDGYQTTQAIRKMEKFKDIPIIAVSAKAMPGDRLKAKEVGCNDFVAKPIDNEHILQVMEEYLPEKPAAKKEDD